LLCTLCHALFAMHSLICTLCDVLFVMHSLLCTLCYALFAMHSIAIIVVEIIVMRIIVVGIAVAASCRMIGAACHDATRRGLMSHYWRHRRATKRNVFFFRHINLCNSKQFYAILGKSAATSEILAHRVNATRRALTSHYWTQRTTTCRNAKQHAATQRDATQRDASSLGKSKQLLGVRLAFGGTFGRRNLMSHTSRHIYACRPHPPKILNPRVNSIETK
jgi:hypothetical protein